MEHQNRKTLVKKDIMDLTLALHNSYSSLTPYDRLNIVYGALCEADISTFFKGDINKIDAWFNIENPSLGGATPNDLIELGSAKKVFDFIKTSMMENSP